MTNSVSYHHLPLIDAELETFLQKHVRKGAAFNAEMARYHFSTGGKRLRALIPVWIFEACKANIAPAVKLGAALEMVHNATLVHDDLQDGDTVRRGKPTVWKKWSPAQAINGGDAMFEFAVEILTEMEIDPRLLVRVIRRISQGTLDVIEGQAQEFLMKDEPSPKLARYLEVIRGKTAALIATSVGAATIALGKNEETVGLAEDAAMQIGILFQLQDDLLDLYGDKGRERVGGDIAEGKISALIAVFHDLASEKDRKLVDEILKKSRDLTTDADIQIVMNLLESSGAKKQVLGQVMEIQAALNGHALGKKEPEILFLIQALGQLFLKPIENLLPGLGATRS